MTVLILNSSEVPQMCTFTLMLSSTAAQTGNLNEAEMMYSLLKT